MGISIHALREEGDRRSGRCSRGCCYFYPRPPRGGRRLPAVEYLPGAIFLSTPSARRATQAVNRPSGTSPISIHALREEGDGAVTMPPVASCGISIHALREEGDTKAGGWTVVQKPISIHALREEGDFSFKHSQQSFQQISIHALREEGDVVPGNAHLQHSGFLSTPSARRATEQGRLRNGTDMISIHALREEGDGLPTEVTNALKVFLSTPSARRATYFKSEWLTNLWDFYPRPPRGGRLTNGYSNPFLQQFLSTPSARRATKSPVPL